MTSIGYQAFKGCTNLESVTIPVGVEEIDYGAFDGCSSLKINYTKYTEGHRYAAANGFTDEPYLHIEKLTDGTVSINGSIIKSGSFAIPSVIDEIPVTKIGKRAFQDSPITGITIPNSVTSIEDMAFFGCKNLQNVVIPEGVTSIGDYAFWDCSNLKIVTLPASITSISEAAFNSKLKMNYVRYTEGHKFAAKYGYTDEVYLYLETYIGDTLSINGYEGNPVSLTIPSTIDGKTVKAIGDGAFARCMLLESVIIPDTITQISDKAFIGCSSLKMINIPASVTYVGDYAIGYIDYSDASRVTDLKIDYVKNTAGHIYVAKNGFTNEAYIVTEELADGTVSIEKYLCGGNVVVPSVINGKKVTKIANRAFTDNMWLESVTIPDSVTNIEDDAFDYSDSLKFIYVKYSEAHRYAVEHGFTDDAYFYTKDLDDGTVAISGCSGKLVVLNIPSEIRGKKVTVINNAVFSHFAALTTVLIPDTITRIGDSAFFGCNLLKSINIPASVVCIGTEAIGYGYNGHSYKIDEIDIDYVRNTEGHRYAYENGFTTEAYDSCNGKHVPADEWITEKNATCISEGVRKLYCKNCGMLLNTEPIPKSNVHQFSGWNITKAATCTATGTKARTCTICGKTEIAVIAKSAHKYVNTVVKPTYTAQGYTLHKCSVCGANYKDTYTAKLKLSKVGGLKVASKTNTGVSLQWNRNTAADGYVLEKYDGKKWVTVKKISGNANVKYTISGLKSSTTYKFRIKAYKSSVSSDFSYLNVNTKPYKTTGMKCTGKTNNSITIKWNKNTSAGGYVLERYNGKKWIAVKTFTSNTNTRFTVSKLSAGKTHKFRLKAYKTFGKVKEYSEYTYLNANTKPNAMTGFGIKSIANNAVTLKWNKNSSASGYCVEKWDGKKWVQVKKLTSNTTVTYKIDRLKKNTVYKFRVRAYKTFGKTSEYSAYTGVATARTKK